MAQDGSTDLLDVEQLALAVELVQDAIVVYDEQARIVIANDRLLAATGYARDELVGLPALSLVSDALREELTPRIQTYVHDPVPRPLEEGMVSRIERKDGSTFEAQLANSVATVASGNLVAVTIRELRNLSIEEIQFRGLLEANPEATLICSTEGKVVLTNASAARLFEREPLGLFNQPLLSLFPSAHAPAIADWLRRCREGSDTDGVPQASRSLDVEVVRRDEVVPVEVSVSPMPTAQGDTLRVIVRDLSERRRLQREAEAEKDGFLATVSHELRTPLTSVLGYGELLEDLGPEDLSDHARSLLDVVVRNARRELRLVDDLLTMVQIGESGFRINTEHLDFYDLVLNAVDAAAPVAQRAQVEVSVVRDEEGVQVIGDPDRLGQAVDNLLTNSLKFSAATGSVNVVLSTDAEMVTLSVTNEGEGIRKADVEHVFDRLYRGGNAVDAEKQGIGLGLSIVRSIVEAHHGDVSVRSTGTTTCFEIHLPRAQQVRAPAPDQRPRGAQRHTPGPGAG